MEFISLIFKKKYGTLVLLILLGLVTGMIHVGLLVAINKILSRSIMKAGTNLQQFINALLLLLSYLTLNMILTKQMIRISQKVIHDLRMALIRSAPELPYQEIILRREGELFKAAVTKDTVLLSRAALSSINLITSVVTVTGCLIYLGLLSIRILFVILALTVIGISVYIFNAYKNRRNLEQARASEDTLFFHVSQVIDGFRELKINSEKSKSLIEGPLLSSSVDSQTYAVKGLFGFFSNVLIGQSLFYMAIIILLFAGTGFFHLPTEVMTNCIITILYLIGPLEMIIAMLPDVIIGNVAASRLSKILGSAGEKKASATHLAIANFGQLVLKDIYYKYPAGKNSDEPGFALGPIGFLLDRGSVTFIYGGNGSGKTTFFHILLGLIKAQKGQIYLNGRNIDASECINELFAPVFSDFHLFDKLYGVPQVDHEKVTYYLQLFELDKKVTFEQDHFSTIDLSTGQRKRLALISALLEKRSLIFLDEWAADQDPIFRSKFYTTILPVLKEEGFTILAITHDDKYYHTADALYRMEFGQLHKER